MNDILDLASIEAGYLTLYPRKISIPTLVKEVNALISKKMELNRQSLIVKCDKAIKEWVVDERRLKQALFNLLNNAIKSTPTDGIITLEVGLNEEELEISVADTSVRTSPKDQERLMEELKYITNDAQIDVGLELSLVKNLIELHGGRIHLFSDHHQGTKVSCFFPKIPHENKLKDETKLVGVSIP